MIGRKTVVYTSGTFDMLHINHLRLIEYARGLGDILIVGVNTDELVASYKSLPMIPFEDRIELVRRCKYFDEAYERLIKMQELDLSTINVNMFKAINNQLINDGCGLFRGRQILPFEHLSRFQNDLID